MGTFGIEDLYGRSLPVLDEGVLPDTGIYGQLVSDVQRSVIHDLRQAGETEDKHEPDCDPESLAIYLHRASSS